MIGTDRAGRGRVIVTAMTTETVTVEDMTAIVIATDGTGIVVEVSCVPTSVASFLAEAICLQATAIGTGTEGDDGE
jgi:hypothetical protein